MPERSGLIKPLMSSASLWESYYLIEFFNLTLSALLGLPNFSCNYVYVVFILLLINYSAFSFKLIVHPYFLSQYSFFILLYNHFGLDCLILTLFVGVCIFDLLMICYVF